MTIKFLNTSNEEPIIRLQDLYGSAIIHDQLNVESIFISSFSHSSQEVNSRIVNLKSIIGDEFIFFSNYDSPKSIEFKEQSRISAILFWNTINVQIRMKAAIKRTSPEFNKRYFKERSLKKNALAISSNQSQEIESYEAVIQNYDKCIKNDDLKKCPDNWGGFSFVPYYYEFWEGRKHRINKRIAFTKNINNTWISSFLQP